MDHFGSPYETGKLDKVAGTATKYLTVLDFMLYKTRPYKIFTKGINVQCARCAYSDAVAKMHHLKSSKRINKNLCGSIKAFDTR